MPKEQGFTLIEMVVAIAIFAVIATISFTTLNQFALTRERLGEHQQRIAQIQNTFILLARDFRYLSLRSIRNGFGDPQAALLATPSADANDDHEIMSLTTNWRSPVNGLWANPVRVRWHTEDNNLIRSVWSVLDQDLDSTQLDQELINDIDSVEVNFFTRDADLKISTVSEWRDISSLPVGVEILLTLSNEITYRRVFDIAGVN